jgi:hypothetical protein
MHFPQSQIVTRKKPRDSTRQPCRKSTISGYHVTEYDLTNARFQPSTYYDRHRQSPALIRARRPYLVKNAVVGLSISAFAIGICTTNILAP